MGRIVLNQIALQKIKVISETKKYFLLQPSSAAAPSTSNYGITPPTYTQTGYSGWSDTEPSYTVGDERVLYELTETIYSDRTWDYSTPTISSSYEAAKEAYNAAIEAEQTIAEFEELGLKKGYIWDNATYVAPSGSVPVYPVGSYIASGILVNGERSITHSNSNTYGLNTWISTGGINLRYNAIDLMKLTTSNLLFYYPSTSTQQKKAISLGTNGAVNSLAFYGFNSDNKTMELTNGALTFYDPSDGSTELAKLNTNGLILEKGGIKAGNYSTSPNKFIYLSTEDYSDSPTITINGNSSGWRQIIGTKFGIKNDGTLYASNVVISGQITVDSGSDLSAGLGDYSTTAQTQTYVTGLGYQTASNVNTIIGQTNVSALNDGSDYTKTENLGDTTAVKNAAKIASNYLGDTDSNAGVTLKAQNGTTTANTSTSNYIKINTSGLEIFKGGVSVALYGDTARIGKPNNSRFLLNADSLQAYNSSNTKYFEVSANGMTYGSNTVASTSYADGKANTAESNAKTAAQGYANTAEANASYSVEIKVDSINYVTNSAKLIAVPYQKGTITTGTFNWYKNNTNTAHGGTVSTTTNTNDTLTITDLNASYIAVLQ